MKVKPLLDLLREVRQWRPGITLWELEAHATQFSNFRKLAESDIVRHWQVDDLVATVERDYAEMTPEERRAFESMKYVWGYTPEGLVSIAVIDPEEGVLPRFVQAPKVPLRKMPDKRRAKQ